MKQSLSVAACAAFAAASAFACGPFFPISYTQPSVVDGTFAYDDIREGPGYSVRINVRYELDLLGRHFFPEWAGRELKYVPMSSEEAHRADFDEASAAAGMAAERTAARLEELLGFADAAKERIEAGENVSLPSDLEGFEREFFLYALGRAQRLADATLAEPPAWLELLALPPASRRYRTVWARHGLVLAAPDVAAADRRLRELRADLDAGFRDTCGLEEAIVLQLLRRDGGGRRLHWLPLAAAVRGSPRIEEALVADADWLRRNEEYEEGRLADVSRSLSASEALRAAAAADPLTAEVLVSLGCEELLPEGLRGAVPVVCADRRAWVAFEKGDFERGRRLLALAPTNSLVRLFWEARLARIDGDYARSADRLRAWLAEVEARGGVPAGVFEVHDDWNEGWLCDTDNEYKPRTRSFGRVVEGELGAVLVTEGDFEEALLAFLRARSWIDAAFVAERCMATDALVAFVRNLPPGSASWKRNRWEPEGDLRWLTARRLLREGRIGAAGEFFPEDRRADWAAYTNLVAAARPDEPLPAGAARDDARALAALNLARLLYARGMELLGTELEPDVHSEDGSYSFSGIGDRTLADLPHAAPPPAPPPSRPTTRFHYRPLALSAARRAAALASDPDVRAAALLLQGQINAISHDEPPKDAEPAYRALCAVPDHPIARAAREARWFPWSAASGFLEPLNRVRRDASLPFAVLSADDLRAALRTTKAAD